MSPAPRHPSDARDDLTLTPLGPGGRPFARWRAPLTLLALAAMAATVAVLLSDQAPGLVGDVSERVSTRVGDRAPDASAAARRAVDRAGIEESDTLAHIGLWAGATVLAGLATWSWASLVTVVILLLLGSTGLEAVQEQLAPTRITEWSDVLANALGIGLGTAVVVAITLVSGSPAVLRRWHRRRAPRRT